MARPDVLLLSLGTTLGWRVADSLFLDQLRAAGADAVAASVRIGASGRLRRAYPVTDLVEALAARRALAAALRDHRPRALVISSTTAAMLADVRGLPYAVRLDAPARLNRPGRHNVPLHRLERRALSHARQVLPWSRAAAAALPGDSAPAVVVPPPIDPAPALPDDSAPAVGVAPPIDPAAALPGESAAGIPVPPPVEGTGDPARERLAVAYTPDVKAKGLDVVCAAWALAGVERARLLVFGVEQAAALAHLSRQAVAVPADVDFLGKRPAGEFRAALRRARVYVGGARWEDFGQAPLEALADGALFATVPSGGPFEALTLARELAPALVAPAIEPSGLAETVRAAFALTDAEAYAYRQRAAALLAPYRPESIQRTVEREVLPALLTGGAQAH